MLNKDSKTMNQETIEMLKVLADKLGTTTEHLWGVLTNQAILYGISEILFLIVIVGLTAWWVRFANFKLKQDTLYGDPDLLQFSIWLVVAFCAIMTPLSIYSAATAFLNPEYWALKEILRK